jgi:hypothetical protein
LCRLFFWIFTKLQKIPDAYRPDCMLNKKASWRESP